MLIHKGALNGAIPNLFTFPMARVCLDCGYSTFALLQSELLNLREASDGADASD
jgi:hypothetical protein